MKLYRGQIQKIQNFYNIVLKISTSLTPLELLSVCKKIEKILAEKKKKNSPRVCDIDIIDYNHKRFLKQSNITS